MEATQKDAQINIIISQTDYDRETAEEKLKKWNNDFIKVIKEFLNPNFEEKERKKKEEKEKIVSLNQSIMTQLRHFKDKQNENHDQYKKFNDYLNKKKEVMELNRHLEHQENLKQKMNEQENKKNIENDEKPEEISI
tara:strand:- start:2081 stop:2491 length:411 start_codon:yes stop_codon:yes gene_type:complete